MYLRLFLTACLSIASAQDVGRLSTQPLRLPSGPHRRSSVKGSDEVARLVPGHAPNCGSVASRCIMPVDSRIARRAIRIASHRQSQ